MTTFDLQPRRRRRNSTLWNVLTVLLLIGSCLMNVFFITIFVNPNSPYNPFPPQPLPTLFQTVTPTNTIIPLAATWTPTISLTPEPSRTTAPTWTLLPNMITSTRTASPIASLTPTPTATRTPTLTPNWAATVTAYCRTLRSKFPGTPCP
jgi:hypothetical protein